MPAFMIAFMIKGVVSGGTAHPNPLRFAVETHNFR
jgi:hypothetical protein